MREGGREGGRERGRGDKGKEREGHDSITIEGGDLFRVELHGGDGDALGQELNIREHTVVCRHSKWHLCPVDGQRNTCTCTYTFSFKGRESEPSQVVLLCCLALYWIGLIDLIM